MAQGCCCSVPANPTRACRPRRRRSRRPGWRACWRSARATAPFARRPTTSGGRSSLAASWRSPRTARANWQARKGRSNTDAQPQANHVACVKLSVVNISCVVVSSFCLACSLALGWDCEFLLIISWAYFQSHMAGCCNESIDPACGWAVENRGIV